MIKLGEYSLQNIQRGLDKMEVNYNVVFVNKNDLIIKKEELGDIIAKKLLRVILATEQDSVALNNL